VDLLREKIQARISQEVGGKAEFRTVDLLFFPRPGVLVRQANLSIPEKVTSKEDSREPALSFLASARINSFALDCQKNRLKVESADISWNDSRLQLGGDVNFSAEGVQLDMDIIVDEFHWGNVEKTFEVTDKEKNDTQTKALSSLPVQGVLSPVGH
jgi:hypothetical protein